MNTNNLIADLRHIESHIELLKDIISQADTHTVIYEFPKLTNLDIGNEPTEIILSPYQGEQATQMALLHMSDFKVDNKEPGLFGRRLAGTVMINTKHEDEITQRIHVINTLKAQFKSSILRLHKNIDKRFEIFKEALPLTSKIASTRQILIAPEQTKSINFSWTHRYSGKRFTRNQLEQKIKNGAGRATTLLGAAEKENLLEIELKALASANHTDTFYQRRPLRVSPTAHIYTEASKRSKTAIAHSPIFIVNQTPNISALHNYPNRTRTSTAKKMMLVIERLHIYCEFP